jgi:hypothetical protein
VAIPGDDLDAPIEEAVGHRGSHQADPEQTHANLLLVSIGIHSVSSIISQAGPIGQVIRNTHRPAAERRIEVTEVEHR